MLEQGKWKKLRCTSSDHEQSHTSCSLDNLPSTNIYLIQGARRVCALQLMGFYLVGYVSECIKKNNRDHIVVLMIFAHESEVTYS